MLIDSILKLILLATSRLTLRMKSRSLIILEKESNRTRLIPKTTLWPTFRLIQVEVGFIETLDNNKFKIISEKFKQNKEKSEPKNFANFEGDI